MTYPKKLAEEMAADAFPLPWNDHGLMLVNRQNYIDAFLAGWKARGEDERIRKLEAVAAAARKSIKNEPRDALAALEEG